MVVTLASADLAQDVNVRHEIHLNPPFAFTLAMFAASARNVKRKTPCFVTTLARLRQHGIQITDMRENAGISRGIRSWRSANGRLINANHFVNMLCAGDGFV